MSLLAQICELPTGDKGEKGATGSIGPPGIMGPKGKTGLKGDTGGNGSKGDPGVNGSKGDTGANGAKGDTGANGAKGDNASLFAGEGISKNDDTISLTNISISIAGQKVNLGESIDLPGVNTDGNQNILKYNNQDQLSSLTEYVNNHPLPNIGNKYSQSLLMSGEDGILILTPLDKEIIIAPSVDGNSSNQQPKAIHFHRYENDPNHHIEIYNYEPMENAIDLYAPEGQISINSSYLNIKSTREDSEDQFAVNLHSENGGINLVAKKNSYFNVEDGELCIQNQYNTTNDAIKFKAFAGGIDIDATESKKIDIQGGEILLNSKDNSPDAIKLVTDKGENETINIVNILGNKEDAININAVAGGIDIDASKSIDIQGGHILLSSINNPSTSSDAIKIFTNNNSNEKIIIQNNQGAADDSINIKSHLGGITLNASTISLDGGVVSSGTLVKKTVVSTINTASNSTLTIDMLMGGLILRDPNSDNRQDTLPTAESIVGGISGAVVGSSFEFRIKNIDTNASHNITISSANGVTTNGTMTIQPSYIRTFLVVCDNVTFNSEAVTIYSLGTLAP